MSVNCDFVQPGVGNVQIGADGAYCYREELEFDAHRFHFWCAPKLALLRTKARSGAHQNLRWCAPKPALVRTILPPQPNKSIRPTQ